MCLGESRLHPFACRQEGGRYTSKRPASTRKQSRMLQKGTMGVRKLDLVECHCLMVIAKQKVKKLTKVEKQQTMIDEL